MEKLDRPNLNQALELNVINMGELTYVPLNEDITLPMQYFYQTVFSV